MLLVGQKKGIRSVKTGMVVCLEQGVNDLHMVQLMPLARCHPSSLASLKSRMVLPFWCWLTQVVLEIRPLNGCSS